MIESLFSILGVSYGTLTLHASAGKLTHLDREQTVRPDKIGDFSKRAS